MPLLTHLVDDDLRKFCLDALRTMNFTQGKSRADFVSAVGRLAFERGLPRGDSNLPSMIHKKLEHVDDVRICEILDDLFIDGIIRPGSSTERSSGAFEWPWFHLTDRGKTVLASPSPTPYDPSGFLGEIRGIAGMDDVVVSYVEESVSALRHNLLRSCVISLGVASERSFTIFIETLISAIKDPTKRQKAEGHLVGVQVQRAFDAFQKSYKDPLIQALKVDAVSKPLAHNFDTYIGSMLLNMKEYRNDAGHALSVATSRRVAEAHLSMFPDYVAKVFGLIVWLKSHTITVP